MKNFRTVWKILSVEFSKDISLLVALIPSLIVILVNTRWLILKNTIYFIYPLAIISRVWIFEQQ